MGKPLMLMDADDLTIEQLKKRMGAKTKIEVVRTALGMLSDAVEKQERIKRWKRAAAAVQESSQEVMRDFQRGSRLKDVP